MGRVSIKIDKVREIAKDAIIKKGAYINEAFELANENFQEKKQELLEDFDNHPVTIEIKEGESLGESSFISGPGNLFSFFGFSQGRRPTDELREALDENTRIVKKSSNARYSADKIRFEFPIFVASLEGELAAASPLEWGGGKSWALAVEGRGFSDIGYFLSHYLFDENKNFGDKSRSGPAIQIKEEYMERTFKQQPYISEIINKFKKKFVV